MQSVGGSLEGFWVSLGEYDLVAIAQFPDSSSVTAFVLVVSATGAVSATRITPLMTSAEAVEAMQKAAEASYRHPHHPDAGR